MKTIHSIRLAASAACIALATLYAPLSHGAAGSTDASLSNPNPTHETVGEGVSDTTITTKIKASLLEQKHLSSTRVHVRTREGVVRLTGSVPSATQKQTAADIASATDGVRSVENHLAVRKL
ncbi:MULTISPECIES: BON domain-containing protein [Cupriavidus]|uniref:BON domain-containing protein n=1 Tax=Cupriavidus sp. 30B13 TaxID=3384241 RepID=UPI003B9111AD